MFLYTNKDLVDVLPLREKTFIECGINTNNLEVIAIKKGTFAFLEVEDLEKYNNSKLEDLTVQTLEERENLILELKAIQQQEREEAKIQQQEREEAKKNTNEYKIATLQEEQEVQNNEIITSMLANTEMFEMILDMLPMTLDTKNISNTKVASNMIEVYTTLILKGQKTIEQVPVIIREQVQTQLDLKTK